MCSKGYTLWVAPTYLDEEIYGLKLDGFLTKEMDASSERGESSNEDILIFFFQLHLATRVQVYWQSFGLDFYKRVKHFVVSPSFWCFVLLTSFSWLMLWNLHYALNVEQCDIAPQLRTQLTEVRSR